MNFLLFFDLLLNSSWSDVTIATDVDVTTDFLYNALHAAFDFAVQRFERKLQHRFYPPWFSSQIKAFSRHKTKVNF